MAGKDEEVEMGERGRGRMKKLSEKFRTWYHHASLASKIRLSYFILLIPVMFFVLYCIYNIWNSNRQYSALIQSTAVASDFSLDFKKEFDYETYLVVAGNKTVEEKSKHIVLEVPTVNTAAQVIGNLPDGAVQLSTFLFFTHSKI